MDVARESPSVPEPLEQYSDTFDDLFGTQIQRQRFREYLAGLLVPRDRNKTLTALVGAEPIVQAQTAPVQQLQFFLREAAWEAEAVTSRRIDHLRDDPVISPHAGGVLVIDETGVRKDGTHIAHVGPQYLGTIGKIANGIVAGDQPVGRPAACIIRCMCCPYTPAAPSGWWQARSRVPHQAAARPRAGPEARAVGIPFRAVVADSLYGEHPEFKRTMWQADIPYVLALKPSQVVWTPPPDPSRPGRRRSASLGSLGRTPTPRRLDAGRAALP